MQFEHNPREEIALNVKVFARIFQRNAKCIALAASLTMSAAVAADISDALAPLTAPSGGNQEIIRALEAAKQLAPAERLVVENYLRLRQGALLMSNQHYAEAREVLKAVETTSPSATQSGLLIAESYRLEQSPEKAKDWFLRTARFYPYRVQTLEGLLSAAAGQRPDNNGLASALYAEIETQAAYALDQLKVLKSSGHIDPIDVIFPSNIDEHVREVLLVRCLQYSNKSLLTESARLQQAVEAMLVLRKQNETLRSDLENVAAQLSTYQQQRERIVVDLAQHDKQLEALKSRLIAKDLSEEQQAIRLHIVQLRNAQTRLRGQMAFIDQASQKLPVIIANVDRSVTELNVSARTRLRESNRSVSAILTHSYEGYRLDLVNLAAQASVQRAEMMMSSAR
jgi:hypothetical protein